MRKIIILINCFSLAALLGIKLFSGNIPIIPFPVPTPPSPIVVPETRMLLINEETDQSNPLVQDCLFWLLQNARGKYQIRDDDLTPEMLAGDLDWVQKAYSLRPKDSELPWLIIGSPNKGGYNGKLPSFDEFKQLVTKYQ